MQVKRDSTEHKRLPAVRITLKLILVACVLHFLYYLFITSSYDVEHIKGRISGVLGVSVSDLNFAGGGRRCDGMVVFEYFGDKKAFYRFRFDVSRNDPDWEEYQKIIDAKNGEVMNRLRSVLTRLDIPVALEDNAELLTCCSDKLPVPCIIYIVVSGNKIFVFYPT